ncbi:MAG: heavy metal translocating P-type ATPase [Lysobacteraceae bacterium]
MSNGRCHHCGDPLPASPLRVQLDGQDRAMCCGGCASAAQWIAGSGLGDYYRLRQSDSRRVEETLPDLSAWDRDDIQRGHAQTVADGSREITLVVEGMHCAACAWLIDRALRRERGVEGVSANAVTGRVQLRWQNGTAKLSSLLERLHRLGYRPYLAAGADLEDGRRQTRRRMLLRLGVAGLGAMQVMMFAEALYLDTAGEMPLATRDFFRWIAVLVSTPVVFFSGWPFIAGMWRELRQRSAGMDTLVGGSILLAWFASLLQTLRGGEEVWFDAAVMFVLFLLAARFLEQMARQRANAQVEALSRARPALATREDPDGKHYQVPIAEIGVGDHVFVAIGEPLPADGRLLDRARLDESLLTGESRPCQRGVGETVFAGSLCLDQCLRLEVTRTGADTRLSHMVRLVDEAQRERPPLALWADRIASRFVSAVLLAALVCFAVWTLLADAEQGFTVALALLVVSCPCALSLAVPAALAAAHTGLSRTGVLALTPRALFVAADVDLLLLDKTGTLTEGRPRLLKTTVFAGTTEEEAVAVAAALESGSRHPLAAAFGATADMVPHAVRQVPGLGISGSVNGRRFRLGRADFACAREDDGAVWLGDGERAHARFETGDRLRDDANVMIDAMHQRGIPTAILSGDGHDAVAAVARTLGIHDWRARQSPEDKLAAVRERQQQGHRVAMLGDGINDAPVLAAADLSIALAEGAALTHRSADLVVLGGRLDRVPQALSQASRLRRIVNQNLIWALAYNALALPVAGFGLVTPGLAALGMALSSLGVTLNALRLTTASTETPSAATTAVTGKRRELAT